MTKKVSRLFQGTLASIFLAAAVLPLSSGAAEPLRERLREPDLNHEFGLGVILGEPTGVTGKVWMSPETAIDFGLAASFDDFTLLYADYLYHFPGAFGHSSTFASRLVPYLGGGAVLAFSSDTHRGEDRHFFGRSRDTFGLGIRIPFGLEWFAPRPHLGIFAELVPGVALVPSSSAFVEGGVGIRFYF